MRSIQPSELVMMVIGGGPVKEDLSKLDPPDWYVADVLMAKVLDGICEALGLRIQPIDDGGWVLVDVDGDPAATPVTDETLTGSLDA